MNLNKALVCGRLTRDPELRATANGAPVANFSIATNRSWTQDGEKREETEFHNVVIFGRQAETCHQHLRKGDTVLVEGRLQTRSWESDDGQKHYRTEIIADRVTFGPRAGAPGVQKNPGEWGEEEVERQRKYEASKGAAAEPLKKGYEYPEEDIDPADIPF